MGRPEVSTLPEVSNLAVRIAPAPARPTADTQAHLGQVTPPLVHGVPQTQKTVPIGLPAGLGFAPVLPAPEASSFWRLGAMAHPAIAEDVNADTELVPSPIKLARGDSPCTSPDAENPTPKHELKDLRLAVPLPMQELTEESHKIQAEVELEAAATWRNVVRKKLASPKCNLSIGIIIMANTVIMGLELDQHAMADPSEGMISLLTPPELPQLFFDGCEVFFFVVFSIEFAFRVYVYRLSMIREASAYVDFAALSPLIMTVVFDLNSDKSLTLLRIVRLLKLFRLLRLIRLFKELNVLALSIASALRALVWIGLLLLIAVYCAAIACTTLIGHNASFRQDDPTLRAWEARYESEAHIRRYWGSIMRSMFTLFQIFTLDDWNQAVRPVVETHQPAMMLFFVVFLFVTTFGLLNLLMGTIVDRAMNIAKESDMEKERILQEDYKQVMLAAVRLFSVMDEDGNGRLSADEINKFLQENDLTSILERELKGMKLKIDYLELLDICQSIVQEWVSPDDDEDDGITMEEFAGAAIKLQGQAKSKDLMSLMIMQKNLVHRVEHSEHTLDKLLAVQESIDKQVNSYKLYFEHHAAKLDSVLQAVERDRNPRNAVLPFSADFTQPSSGRSAESLSQLFRENDQSFARPLAAGSAVGFGEETRGILAEMREPPRLTTGSVFSDVCSEAIALEPSAELEGDLAGRRGDPPRSAPSFSLRDERQALREAGGRVQMLLKQISAQDDFAGAEVAAAMTRYAEQRSARDAGSARPTGGGPASDVLPRLTAPAFPSSWRRRASAPAPEAQLLEGAAVPPLGVPGGQSGPSIGPSIGRRLSRMRLGGSGPAGTRSRAGSDESQGSPSPRCHDGPSDSGFNLVPHAGAEVSQGGNQVAEAAQILPGSLPEST